MSVWVCRTGTRGEFADLFFENSCICLTRPGLNLNLSLATKSDVQSILHSQNPDVTRQTVSNIWSQIDIFANRMNLGDIVIIPKKATMLISVAKIVENYSFDEEAGFPLQHKRSIIIIDKDIDIKDFPLDIIRSLGAFRTIFAITQEKRLIDELKKKGVEMDL